MLITGLNDQGLKSRNITMLLRNLACNLSRTHNNIGISANLNINPVLFSTTISRASGDASQFDGEQAELYHKIFTQHYHESGPWKKMINATEDFVGTNVSPSILDLATGPGEPGTSLAKKFPNGTITLSDIAPDMVEKAKAFITREGVSNAKVIGKTRYYYYP